MTPALPTTVGIETGLVDGLRVVTLSQPSATRQALVFMGIQACLDPFEVQRFAVLAHAWDAAVTVVDTPGYGYGGARLTGAERRGLLRGDFTALARRMVRVAQRHNPRLLTQPVHVTGYSMGASVAAAAAGDAGLLRIDELVLVEPVALRHWHLTSLLRSVRLEDGTVDDYLAHNDELAGAVLPESRRGEEVPHSRRDLALLGFGVSRGRLPRDILQAAAIQRFGVKVVHGTDSRLSRAPDNASLIESCRRAGIDIQDIAVEGHHALWQSLPRVDDLASRIRPR